MDEISHESNQNGAIAGISSRNQLGPHILKASLPELGPGGSWSTCTNGGEMEPPHDVAHIQFQSRVAFKLVWCPPEFERFVLVDDEGHQIAAGKPSGAIPDLSQRERNYYILQGGRYATAAASTL